MQCQATSARAFGAPTSSAAARGVFGAPSFFVGEELFFGKDRLTEVEDEIGRQRQAGGG